MSQLSDLGNIPLIVIRRGKGLESAQVPGFSEETVLAVEQGWIQLQENLTLLSSNSELWVAENSGHNIPLEQPEIIIQAVLQLLIEVQGNHDE